MNSQWKESLTGYFGKRRLPTLNCDGACYVANGSYRKDRAAVVSVRRDAAPPLTITNPRNPSPVLAAKAACRLISSLDCRLTPMSIAFPSHVEIMLICYALPAFAETSAAGNGMSHLAR